MTKNKVENPKNHISQQDWQEIETKGYPPIENDPFYEDRYSIPVLAGNKTTGQVALCAYMWDFEKLGWVYASMIEGTDPGDYEVQHVSHWALWPDICVM